MSSATASVAHTSASAVGERPRLSARAHLITIVLASWSVTGLFIDGWAHNGEPKLESFFTVWHGILYAGFTATAAWMARQAWDHRPSGKFNLRTFVRTLPVGYGLGLLGIAMVGAGAVIDFAWHEAFGFDAGVEAPFSPPHQILFTGGVLTASTPLRAMWSERFDRTPSLGSILAPLLSLTMTLAVVIFFLHYHTPFFMNVAPSVPFEQELSGFDEAHIEGRSLIDAMGNFEDNEFPYVYYSVVAGTASILITNLILLAGVLLLIRRWRAPFGSITLMFTTIGVLASILAAFRDIELLAMTIGAGVIGDLLIARLKPFGPERATALRAVSMLIPVGMWTVYFIVTQLAYGGIGWTLAIWSGCIIMSSLAGLGLSLLIAPTAADIVDGESAAA